MYVGHIPIKENDGKTYYGNPSQIKILTSSEIICLHGTRKEMFFFEHSFSI